MQVTIYTSDQGSIDVSDFDTDSLAAFLDAWRLPGEFVLQVNVDDSIVYLARRHIVRVDVD